MIVALPVQPAPAETAAPSFLGVPNPATDRTGQHQLRLKVTQACLPPLIGNTFLGSSQWSIRSAQCCISFVREPISASGPCFL